MAPTEAETGKRPLRLLWALPAIALLAAGVLAWRFSRPHTSDGAAIHSVAVLPFVNASKDPEMDFLSDGMSAEITNSLSRLSNLQVMASSTVARYKTRQDDPQGVGRELHVDAVLTGRVAEHGDKLDVGAELVNVTTGVQLWGQRYERGVNEASQLQAAITSEVASQLQPRLSGSQRESIAKAGTSNAEAYQLYLKGRYHEEKYTRADVNTGNEEFRRAIQLDPNYAAAYAGIAYPYVIANDFFLSPNDSMPPAREAAKKALQLDELNPESHIASAWVKWGYDYDPPAGEADLKRAIKLAPRDGSAHWTYGYFLVLGGKTEAGIEEGRRAVALDPASLETNAFLGGDLYYGNRYDEAVKQLRTTIDMEPNYWLSRTFLGMAYEEQGDLPGALDQLEKATAVETEIPFPLAELGHLYARMGRKQDAEKVLQQLLRRGQKIYVPPYNLATVYIGLGQKEQALASLEKAYADRSLLLMFVGVYPESDSLPLRPPFRRSGGEGDFALAFRPRYAGKPNFLPMRANLGHNIERKRERAAAVFKRHHRRTAFPYRVKKRLQFRMQRLFRSHRWFGHFNLWIDRGSACRCRIGSDGEDEHLLASIVDRDILLGLEETQLAHALGRDAAGGEVGHTSRFEFQPHIGDIRLSRKNRQAHGANLFHRRIGKSQHDIQIVDHQIEHHIHIERPRCENAQAMHFEKHRLSEQRDRGAHRGIEALQMSNLGNAFVSAR